MFEVHIIASGSDGNCTVIEFDDEAIMIDAGLSCKKLTALMGQEGFDPEKLTSLLITHEHSDHVCGAGASARKLDLDVYCNINTFNGFNAGNVRYNEIFTSTPFTIGNLNITPLPTSHNAADPCAYMIQADGKTVLVATDTGKLTAPVEEALALSDVAVIESNYDKQMLKDGPYPYYLKKLIGSEEGHLSNIDCAEALKRHMNPNRNLFLAHLSRTNNTPDVARETVSEITGIKRMKIDCLEFQGDTRTLTVKD